MKVFQLHLLIACFVINSACAQGLVHFANVASGVGGIVNAPFDDNVNGPYAGDRYAAQLYFAPGVVFNSELMTTNGISGAPAPFLTGNKGGYFVGGPRSIAGSVGGSLVSLQVRVWAMSSGSSWENATVRAESNIIQITLGTLPMPPPVMAGLSTFRFSMIPEPSTIALGLLGLGALALVRRRK